MKKTTFEWLDLLRGVSALLVCANHLRAVMFVEYGALGHTSASTELFYFLTGLGGQSVVVFFALSGFFVGGSVLRRRDDFRYGDYLLSRLTRLWVVLLPALALTFMVDQFTALLAPGVLAGTDRHIINSGPAGDYSASLATLLQNVVFLQTITAPVFGSNGPLWSLCYEFWYYMAFPALVLLACKQRRVVQIVVGIAIVSLGLAFLRKETVGFIVWALGAASFCIPVRSWFSRPLPLVVLALPLFVAALTVSKLKILGEDSATLMLGAAGVALILALRVLPPMGRALALVSRTLSRVSYTLYLVHFPLVVLTYSVFFRNAKVSPDILHCLEFTGLLLALVLVAQALWGMFEKHTERVKARVLAVHQQLASSRASA